MPGTVLHEGAQVMCSHAGQAQPPSTYPRVRLSGMAVAVQPIPSIITGCPLPTNAGGPCVTGQWVVAATRVKANFMPVLLLDSRAVAAPTGTPLQAVGSQPRVSGT